MLKYKHIKINKKTYKKIKTINLKAFDIKNDILVDERIIEARQINKLISSFYDKRNFEDDINNGISVEFNGKESNKKNFRVIKKHNSNIIGHVVANGTGFDNPRLGSALTIAGRYDENGEFLRKDNFIEILPIFFSWKIY